MNGIVGFKPTVGLLSQEHIIPISSTQDTAGPMTLTVEGAAIMMDAMTEGDSSYVDNLGKAAPQSITIGILSFAKGNNFGVNKNFNKAIEELKAKGFNFVEIEAWDPGEGFFEAAYKVLKYEFKATLNNYLPTTNTDVEVRSLKDLIEFNKKDERELKIFDQSIFLSSEKLDNLNSEDYKESLELILSATRENGIDKLMEQYKVDFLMAPSAAPTFLIDHMYGDTYPGGTGAGWIPAIAGYPHITVPMGTYKNLPTGLSFMAGSGQDKEVIAMGYAYEQASGSLRIRPSYLPSIETATSGNVLEE
jgi:amidase